MYIPGGFSVRVRDNFTASGFDIVFMREAESGMQIMNLKRGAVNTINPNHMITNEMMDECSLFISRSNAQKLIEELRSMGVSDKEKSLAEGRLEKQTDHLKDLQNILRTKGVMK